jgi:hypothetical protein
MPPRVDIPMLQRAERRKLEEELTPLTSSWQTTPLIHLQAGTTGRHA